MVEKPDYIGIRKELNVDTCAEYTGFPRRNVPDFGRMFLYVKVHRYNPKHLHPKLNGYGDNGQRSLKV